jgi:hypothetical protein
MPLDLLDNVLLKHFALEATKRALQALALSEIERQPTELSPVFRVTASRRTFRQPRF